MFWSDAKTVAFKSPDNCSKCILERTHWIVTHKIGLQLYFSKAVLFLEIYSTCQLRILSGNGMGQFFKRKE